MTDPQEVTRVAEPSLTATATQLPAGAHAASANGCNMDVKRYAHNWRMRWTTSAEKTPAPHSAAPEELCARCDDSGVWITVPDIRPLPPPTVIYDCGRCGTMTAHADFPVILRSIGD